MRGSTSNAFSAAESVLEDEVDSRYGLLHSLFLSVLSASNTNVLLPLSMEQDIGTKLMTLKTSMNGGKWRSHGL